MYELKVLTSLELGVKNNFALSMVHALFGILFSMTTTFTLHKRLT